jgi:chaperone BCS1
MQEYFDIAYNFVKLQMQTNQFFSAAALSSVLLSIAYTLKSVPYRIWGRIHRLIHYSATIEQEDRSFRYINEWLADKHPKEMRNVEIKTVGDELQKTHENDYMYVWKNWRRIRLSKNKQKLEHASGYDSMFNRTYSFSGYGAKKAIDNLLAEAIEYGKSKEAKKTKKKLWINVYAADRGPDFTFITNRVSKTFNELFLADKDKLIEDLKQFVKNNERYKELRIPFKRGYLFYGTPGNGKSSIAYAIADYLKYDVYTMDISTMTSSDFVQAYNKIPNSSVIVLEDVDTCFNGRKNINNSSINFSTFINALSGVGVREDIITIITTNNIEAIDSALMREGRCDFKFEIKNPTKELAEEFLEAVYGVPVTLHNFPDMPFVKLQELVIRNINDKEKCIEMIHNYEQVQEQDNESVQE